MADTVAASARIGSVFLRTSNSDLCRAVLSAVFGERSVADREGGWLEVPGEVAIFVEPTDEAGVPESAGFGIKVSDAAPVAESLRGVEGLLIGDLFDVAPAVHGFVCRGQGLPELFIHE